MTDQNSSVIQSLKAALKEMFPDDHIRVQLHVRDHVLGYAIEVTRTINGDMYDYVGWVSMQMIRLNRAPWKMDQKVMAERAFAVTIKEIAH